MTNQVQLVGFAGNAGVGKSTCARYLQTIGISVPRWIEIGMADELKRCAMRWFGFLPDQLWGVSERRNEHPPGKSSPTVRHACQVIGEMGRQIDSDVWVYYALKAANLIIT